MISPSGWHASVRSLVRDPGLAAQDHPETNRHLVAVVQPHVAMMTRHASAAAAVAAPTGSTPCGPRPFGRAS
jgi:hypothetical protein